MSEVPSAPSRTFTLRDLFVAVAAVAILMALGITYLNYQRQKRLVNGQSGCRNQMKQLTLALQNHNDAFKRFPPLFTSNNTATKANPPLNPTDAAGSYSWQTKILPFIEEDTLFKSISAKSTKFTQPSEQVQIPLSGNKVGSPGEIRIEQFLCHGFPGDTADGLSNYVALSATRLPLLTETEHGRLNPNDDKNPAAYGTKFKLPPDGLIVPDRGMRGSSMARMLDGPSYTAVLIESREEQRSNWYDPRQSFVVGFVPGDSTAIDAAASSYYPYYDPVDPPADALARTTPRKWCFNPAAGNRTALNFGPQNSASKDAYHGIAGDPLERTWGPSSAHLNGAIVVGMGDGSVREIKADIDPEIFFSAITVRGGENSPELPR